MWLISMRHIGIDVEFLADLVLIFSCAIITATIYPPIPALLILVFLYWRLPK